MIYFLLLLFFFLSLGGTCQTLKPLPCRMRTQPTSTSLKRLNAKSQKEAVLLSSIIKKNASYQCITMPLFHSPPPPQNRNNIKNGSILRLTTSAVSSTFEFIYVFLASLKALSAGGTCLLSSEALPRPAGACNPSDVRGGRLHYQSFLKCQQLRNILAWPVKA